MPNKKDINPSEKSATPRKVFMGKAVLEAASKAATRKANKRAFKHVDELLVVKDGWLVRINAKGTVVKRVKQLTLTMPAKERA